MGPSSPRAPMAVVACIAALVLFVGAALGQSRIERLPAISPAVATPTAPSGAESLRQAGFLDAPSPSSADVAVDLSERLEAVEAELAELKCQEAKRRDDAASGPTSRLSTQLQVDYWEISQDAASYETFGKIPEGAAFRRARIQWLGSWLQSEYKIGFDFALPGRPSFVDVYAGLNDLPHVNRVRIGHFFEPFSLEQLTSNRYLTFMERSLPNQAFAPARNLGITAYWWAENERSTAALGLFRGNSNFFGDDQADSDENAFTGRVTWLPRYDEQADGRYYTHVGFCYSLRGFNNDTGLFFSQPEARLGSVTPNIPNFVDTGDFPAGTFHLLDAEFAWVEGPLSVQAEYMLVPVDRFGGSNPTFNGGYIYVSYFLTGEHRPYRREEGTFDRVIPYENFFRVCTSNGVRTGKGAWEVALRLSHIDLTDQGIEGGRLTNATVGLNWYMTPYMRITTNYIHAFLDNPTYGDSGTDLWGMRFNYDF